MRNREHPKKQAATGVEVKGFDSFSVNADKEDGQALILAAAGGVIPLDSTDILVFSRAGDAPPPNVPAPPKGPADAN